MLKEYMNINYNPEVINELKRDIDDAEITARQHEDKISDDSLVLGEKEYELGFASGIAHALDKLDVEVGEHPVFGGIPVTRELAQLLLEIGIPRGCELMCYEYGKCQGDECPSQGEECRCWTSVYPDDLGDMLDEDTAMLSLEYRYFELVKVE